MMRSLVYTLMDRNILILSIYVKIYCAILSHLTISSASLVVFSGGALSFAKRPGINCNMDNEIIILQHDNATEQFKFNVSGQADGSCAAEQSITIRYVFFFFVF